MNLWIISILLFAVSLRGFGPFLLRIRSHLGRSKHREELKTAVLLLRQLKEALECGLVPEPGEWNRISEIPQPWGSLFHASLMELRKQGAPVLPSLKRMMESLEEERELQIEAETRTSQAWGQVMISAGLVPFFSMILYGLLPGPQRYPERFLVVVMVSFLMAMMAFYWMLVMMDRAKVGGLELSKKSWLVSSKIFFEKMTSDLMCGHPPDVAWVRSVDFLRSREPELLQSWGLQIWDPVLLEKGNSPMMEGILIRFGHQIRTGIQISLVEGRGSLDRLDSTFRSFLHDLRMGVSGELQRLPNHCLKPLFILVFPAILLLLFGSLAMSVEEWIP